MQETATNFFCFRMQETATLVSQFGYLSQSMLPILSLARLQSFLSAICIGAVSASSQLLLSSSTIIIVALSGTFQSNCRIRRLIRHVAGSASGIEYHARYSRNLTSIDRRIGHTQSNDIQKRVLYRLGGILGSVGHKVKIHKITPATGKERGDLEIKDYSRQDVKRRLPR